MDLICGTSFQELAMDAKNEGINVFDKVQSVREEKLKLYVDCGKALFLLRFPEKVCIHCGSSKNV